MTGFVNVSGNPKLDRLDAAIERVLSEGPVSRGLSVVPDWDTVSHSGLVADSWDTPLPASRDSRGRVTSPIIRDEFIDTP